MDGLPSADSIKELVALFAPGLIILAIRASVQGGARPELKDRLLGYAAVSAAYYAAAYPLFHWKGGIQIDASVWYLSQYFLTPAAIGLLAAYESQEEWLSRLARRLRLRLTHSIPAAWDFAFSRVRSGTFVLVTLMNGDRVGGLMGSRSFASSSKDERDLLLEEVWYVNDQGSWNAVEPVRSILLCGRDIRHVEIYRE